MISEAGYCLCVLWLIAGWDGWGKVRPFCHFLFGGECSVRRLRSHLTHTPSHLNGEPMFPSTASRLILVLRHFLYLQSHILLVLLTKLLYINKIRLIFHLLECIRESFFILRACGEAGGRSFNRLNVYQPEFIPALSSLQVAGAHNPPDDRKTQ